MKKQFIAVFIFLSYCVIHSHTQAQETSIQKTFSWKADDMQKLYLSGYFQVELVKGSEEKIMMIASEEIKNQMKVQVSKGKVHIKGNAKTLKRMASQRVKIQVYYKQLEAISARDQVNLIGKDFIQSEEFDLVVIGESRVELKVKTKDLKAWIRRGSQVWLEGTSNAFQAKIRTGSLLRASQLKTKVCRVSARDESKASVFVQEAIYISTKTGGLIEYRGNPGKVAKWGGISLNIEF